MLGRDGFLLAWIAFLLALKGAAARFPVPDDMRAPAEILAAAMGPAPEAYEIVCGEVA